MKNAFRKAAFALFSLVIAMALGQVAVAQSDLIGNKLGDQNGTGTCTCNGVACPCTGGDGTGAGRADLGVAQVSGTGLASKDLRIVIGNVISVALGFIGVIMLGIMVYSGFLWMTSGGDEGKVADAKKWIFGAVVGLAVILCAYAITQFVISSLITATTSAT